MFATKQQRTLRGAPATLQSIGYDLITKITLSLRGGTTRQSQDANVTHKILPSLRGRYDRGNLFRITAYSGDCHSRPSFAMT